MLAMWSEPFFWVVLLIVAIVFYLLGLRDRSSTPPPD